MKPWIYEQNPFLNATDESFISAMDISLYHDTALDAAKSDPFFLTLYNAFHPLHVTYETAYISWKTQGGKQQGETLNLKQLLKLLAGTKIQEWDVKIQNLYPVNLPSYKKLLPNRRIPFQSGGQISRIEAVRALSLAIGSDNALADVKTDVDKFYTRLDTALNTQKGSISASKGVITDLESARVAMCIGMFANLGAITQKFAATPKNIGMYFDLKTIRKAPQVYFTGHLKAGEIYTIAKRTFGETDEVWISNPGPAPLKFYLHPVKNGQPNSEGIILVKEEQTVLASVLGKLTDTYLTVLNTDPLLPGEFTIAIL